MLNNLSIQGRLTADPVIRYTAQNTPVCSFTLAVERSTKNKETGKRETDFIDFVAWQSVAEFIVKFFKKGDQIIITGSIQSRVWKDKDGHNRKSIEIVASSAYFAESKRQDTASKADAPEDETDAFLELANDGELPF